MRDDGTPNGFARRMRSLLFPADNRLASPAFFLRISNMERHSRLKRTFTTALALSRLLSRRRSSGATRLSGLALRQPIRSPTLGPPPQYGYTQPQYAQPQYAQPQYQQPQYAPHSLTRNRPSATALVRPAVRGFALSRAADLAQQSPAPVQALSAQDWNSFAPIALYPDALLAQFSPPPLIRRRWLLPISG